MGRPIPDGGTDWYGRKDPDDRPRPAPPETMVPEVGTMQVLLGEGELDGIGPIGTLAADWLKYIYLDGTPIRNTDNSWNFKGFSLALVAGTPTQAAVKGITGTESETSVNVQVTQSTYVTRTISSNPSAVRVRIGIPALKIVDTSTGNARGNTVTIKIERQCPNYTPPGGSLGAWENCTLDKSGVISNKFETKFTKSYRIDTPATGNWQIRVSRISADDADVYHLSQTWFDAYTEIVDARLRYPRSAVLSFRGNSKQFRAMPKITVLGRMNKILVPSNYDPITRTYYTTGFGTSGGAWDGTFGDRATSTLGKKVWSDNPAWHFLDKATNTVYGAGNFLQASGLDKGMLYSIAQWCDAVNGSGVYVGVPDGKGGTESRMTANFYLQGAENAIKALGQFASIFWGVLYYASGLVTPVADSDTAPVAVFTNSNVKDGRFTYEGTARQARHTSAIVKFINPELGWTTDSAVYDSSADAALISYLGYDPAARYGDNILDLQGFGCTSQGQALRLGKQAVLTELLAPEVVSFTSGLEGSTVKPGDVVQLHDQFRAGQIRLGGMTAAGCTTTVIQLDGPVTLGAGTNRLKIRTASGLEVKTITTGAGTTSTLTVSSAFSVAPGPGIAWIVESPTSANKWRVLSVGKGEGLEYSITALYHDPQKYVLLGLSTGDVIPRPQITNTSPAPSGLAITSSTRILNDRQVQTLSASWTQDAAGGYIAQARRDYGPWSDMIVTGATATLDNIQPGVWDVQVCGDWRAAGLSPWSTASATIGASSTIPPWISAGVDAVTPDTLTPGEKPEFIQDYTVLTGEHAGLVSQATTYSVSHSAYDTAYTALVTTYLPTLTSPYAWNSLVGNTNLGTGNRVALWNARWSALRTAANDLKGAIASGVFTSATAAAATDAQNKANVAQLKSQPHKVAWAYSAKPSLPDSVNYPAGYFAITSDWKQVQVNPAGTAWDDVLVAATGVFGKLFSSQVVVQGENLIPNANSEITAPLAGSPESVFLADIGAAYPAAIGTPVAPNGWGRLLKTLGAGVAVFDYLSSGIPCANGNQFRLECYATKVLNSSGTAYLGMEFTNSVGAATSQYVTVPAPSTWAAAVRLAVDATAPNSFGGYPVVSTRPFIQITGDGTYNEVAFNQFYLRLKVDANVIVDGAVTANKLDVDFATANVIRSSNWNGSSSAQSTLGYKISGTGFTAKAADGSTATVQADFANATMIGGYLVGGLTARAMNPIGDNGLTGATFRCWYRGNNNATLNGAPNINCVSIQSISSFSYASVRQVCCFTFKIIPSSYTNTSDNLDGLRFLRVRLYTALSSTAPYMDFKVPCTDRTYDGSTGQTGGTFMVQWAVGASHGSGLAAAPYNEQAGLPGGYMRITLYNAAGPSADKDLAYSGTAGADWGTTTITGQSASSGGGSGYGGYCPAPDVPLLMADGNEKPAGEIRAGDLVVAWDEEAGREVIERVTYAESGENERWWLMLSNGRAGRFARNHRFLVESGDWCELQNLTPGQALSTGLHVVGTAPEQTGPVIKIIVDRVHTYLTLGIVSHNGKTGHPE